jgi:hypothetical protein
MKLRQPYTILLAIPVIFLVPASQAAPPDKIAFNRDIRPILAENCFACHGHDKNARKAKLRLDDRDWAIKKRAIVPGQPGKSELVFRIYSQDPGEIMPPPKSKKKLTTEQKETLKRWIAQGAPFEAHWAYMPLKRPPVPAPKISAWVRNPIDAFILQALEANGFKPSPDADRRTLIRRLSLDLVGLPPSPEEVRAFLADKSPRAYENLVDRLLASPHYGERMAVPWLDVVRYADTVGYHGDQLQRIFPYRDYVIDSFNKNKPFDQFTIEQLAGDLLPNPTTEQWIATGFNRLNMMTREGGAQPREYLARYAADRVRTLGMAWLGSTLGCCECHDHKFDPFTMKDFYQLESFFTDIKQWGVYQDYDYTPNPDLRGWSNDHPFPPEILVASPALKRRMANIRRQMDDLFLAEGQSAGAKQREAYEQWRRASLEFLEKHPEGWQHLSPEGRSPMTTDGRVTLESSGKDASRFHMKMRAGWIASLRVELFPEPRPNGKIVRGGNGTLRLTAELATKDAPKAKALQFRWAEADRKEPTYRAGEEVLGIKNGWRLSTRHLDKVHRAYWLLQQPAYVRDGDVLTISLKDAEVVSARVSFSPFASENPRTMDVRALQDELRSRHNGAAAYGAYLLGTAAQPKAYQRYLQLHARWLECRDGKAWTMVTQAVPRPLAVRVLARGNWQDESGEIVQPHTPHFLPQTIQTKKRLNRLDLAKWIVSSENPLTARVIMNRLWKDFFGKGISARVDDLGAQGEWPSHPELLDWLAAEFRESGWDFKHMATLIVTSSTYRQVSDQRPELREADPGNRLLGCQNPRRLEAEFVRDNALAIAGLINLEYGGPSAWPYQPARYYANLQFPDRDYIADKDGRQYRRGVYMHWQRTFLHPMLANFDAPTREDCIAARNVANTPQQALTLLNDPTFVEAARVFAARILSSKSGTDAGRIDRAYEIALARPSRAAERESLLQFLASQRRHFQTHPADAARLLTVGIAAAPQDIPQTELAAWTSVCRAILNLHETITRY